MTSNSNTFSSEGFDLDAIPRGEDAEKILELGGGVSFERPISNEKPVESKSPSSSSTRLSPEIQKAEDFKTKGNDAFKAHDYYGAIVSYTDAIEAVPTDAAAGERTGEEMLRERDEFREALLEKRRQEYDPRRPGGVSNNDSKGKEEDDAEDKAEEDQEKESQNEQYRSPTHRHSTKLAVYYCNRAACYLHLSQYESAINDADVTIMYNPTYTKAYVRRMTAYEQLDKIEEALRDAQTALQLEPTNRPIQLHVKRLTKIHEEKMEKLKEETLGKLKELGNSILGNFGLSLDNFNAVKDPDTGSYSISFNK